MNMQVSNNYISQRRDEYMLQYILLKDDVFSMTGFKVLQGQQKSGFIPCYRVVFNGKNKLSFDIQNYHNLASLLGTMSPQDFLQYIYKTFAVVAQMKEIGFLFPAGLETDLEKIFVDVKNKAVHMVCLPISEEYAEELQDDYVQVLKGNFLKGITENSNLRDSKTDKISKVLESPNETLDTVLDFIKANFPEVKDSIVNLPVRSENFTGEVTREISAVSSELNTSEIKQSEKAKKKEKSGILPRKSFFGSKKDKKQVQEEESSGTEVLGALFVPSIVLVGIKQKDEVLIKKQEFVIGKQEGKTDYAISYSAAVSRLHCKISHNEGKNYLIDLGSSNGTYINGRKLEPESPTLVSEGDTIKLGNVSFAVRSV